MPRLSHVTAHRGRASCNVVPCGWMAGREWPNGRMALPVNGCGTGAKRFFWSDLSEVQPIHRHGRAAQPGSAHCTALHGTAMLNAVFGGFEVDSDRVFRSSSFTLTNPATPEFHLAPLWTWIWADGFGSYGDNGAESLRTHKWEQSTRDQRPEIRTVDLRPFWEIGEVELAGWRIWCCSINMKRHEITWTFTRMKQVGNEQSERSERSERSFSHTFATRIPCQSGGVLAMRIKHAGDTNGDVERAHGPHSSCLQHWQQNSHWQVIYESSTSHWPSWTFFNVMYIMTYHEPKWSNDSKWIKMNETWSSHAALRLQRFAVFSSVLVMASTVEVENQGTWPPWHLGVVNP